MPKGSGSKRERQYEHIKDSARERGASEKRAKEMAARTVNKERARSGETRTTSRSSSRSQGGPTYDQLYAEAKRRDIPGRSSMNKAELERKLGR
ncbi:plasmid stabilization protein [Streptomyces sp. NPDC049577]|uniref:plasmid stabilization protein n=1 Tax=Streptomyces sp. NPDC049577 TaxID=3155153 RepID=UPI00342422A7